MVHDKDEKTQDLPLELQVRLLTITEHLWRHRAYLAPDSDESVILAMDHEVRGLEGYVTLKLRQGLEAEMGVPSAEEVQSVVDYWLRLCDCVDHIDYRLVVEGVRRESTEGKVAASLDPYQLERLEKIDMGLHGLLTQDAANDELGNALHSVSRDLSALVKELREGVSS